METNNTNIETTDSGNGLGGKIAITIIVLILVIGGIYFLIKQKAKLDIKKVEAEKQSQMTEEQKKLDDELNVDAELNLDEEFSDLDKELSQ